MHWGALRQLRDRQSRGTGSICSSPFLRDLSSTHGGGGRVSIDTAITGAPPFCAAFSTNYEDCHLLALSDEDGIVYVINTAEELPSNMFYGEYEPRPRGIWSAHNNAIFDIQWLSGDSRLVTAAGDHTLAVWDTAHARQDLDAHESRSQLRKNSRATTKTVIPKTPQTGSKGGSKKGITSTVLLNSDAVLASGSAQDGKVKFWDLRSVGGAADEVVLPSDPEPEQVANVQLPPWGTASNQRQYGITCLAQDPMGSRLLVSASNSVHYLFSTISPWTGPIAKFTGHIMGSFYIKTAFSPDGSHIASGSSDNDACIWAVDGPDYSQPLRLRGHQKEVTGVAWCPTNLFNVATCSDDHTLRVWKSHRQLPQPSGQDTEELPITPAADYILSGALLPTLAAGNTFLDLASGRALAAAGENGAPDLLKTVEKPAAAMQRSILEFFATPCTAAALDPPTPAAAGAVDSADDTPLSTLQTPGSTLSARPSQVKHGRNQASILDFYNAQPQAKRLCTGSTPHRNDVAAHAHMADIPEDAELHMQAGSAHQHAHAKARPDPDDAQEAAPGVCLHLREQANLDTEPTASVPRSTQKHHAHVQQDSNQHEHLRSPLAPRNARCTPGRSESPMETRSPAQQHASTTCKGAENTRRVLF